MVCLDITYFAETEKSIVESTVNKGKSTVNKGKS